MEVRNEFKVTGSLPQTGFPRKYRPEPRLTYDVNLGVGWHGDKCLQKQK